MYKILILDDEYYNHLLLEDILEDYPAELEILTAEFGDAGLELIMKEKPDVVFLDRVLPMLDGLEICRIIKQNPELQEIKIIIVSALKAMTAEDRDAADAYLQKPYNSSEIIAVLEKVLLEKR